MKKFLSLLLMMFMAIGTAWAAETVFYTLDGTITGGTSGYATESEITQSEMTWMVTGNTTMNPWRIGGKSLTDVDREAYSTTAMGSAISKVTLEVGTANLTVNSIKLTVASDANFSKKLYESSVSFTANSTITFVPTTGSEWATGAYYKFTFNVTTGTSNQYVQFVGAKFYKNAGGDDPVVITPPTFDPAAGEVVAGTEVTITGDEGTTITYTTDGTDPTESETALTVDGNEATVTVNETMTIKAVAMDADLNISEVATASYTIKVVPTGYIFYESFDGTEGTGGNDNLWSGQIANTTAVAYDNEGWTTENVYAANKCIKLGTGSKLGTAETPTITLTAGQAYTLTFKAAAWNANNEKTTLNLSATGATLSEESIELTKGAWTDYTVVVTATEAAANIKWEASNASSNRFFLDEVLLVEDSDTPPVVIVAPPTFSPAAGQVAYGTEVTISSEQGTTITYTSDGTDPTTSETALTVDGNEETILICDNITLKAFATNGTNVSSVATAAYTLIMPAAPTFSPAAGKVEAGTVVTITGAEGTTITYTTDGTDPIESGTALTAESNVATVTVNEAMTIKAVAMDNNALLSEVATAAYTIQQSGGDQPLTAQFDFDHDYKTLFPNLDYTSLDNGGDAANFTENETATVDNISVTVTPKESGTDNRIWKAAPRLRMYSGSLTVAAPQGYNVTAIAFTHGTNFNLSADKGNLSEGNWTGETPTVVFTCSRNTQINNMTVTIAKIEEGAVEMPTISGTTPFVGSTEVTITAQAGDIRYTIDGTDPTPNSTLYEAPFEITATTTVKAIAIVDGKSSNVASMTFEALPSVENIADFYTQQPSNTVAFANSVIAIAQSSDKKYTYAQDASSEKGLLIYNNKSGGIGVTYSLGEVIPAGFQGNYTVYRNQPELTYATGFTAATSTVEVTPIELTPDQVTADNIFRYAVIKGATLTSDGKIVVGENSVIRFNRFDVNDPEDLTKTYDIYGVTGIFDENLQFMPIRFEEVVEETGVTLAEALAGENGDVKIISDMQVVVANNAYAIVSDGDGNWLKLTNASELEQGQVVTNVTGAISGLELNPVMTVTGFVESDNQVEVTTKQLNLGTIHRTALTELKPNEVADFVGYYNAQTSELCAFSSGSGLHIAMATDNMVGEIVAGKQQTITGVVELKAAWDAPAGAPARVAIDDDQAFENIRIDATAASVPTGVETVKAIDGKEIQGIYNVNGQQVKNAQNGVYIIRYTDGTAAKVRF